jgi:hypothetical protein
MWKEVVMTSFKVPSQHLPGRNDGEEKMEKLC